MGSSEGGRGCKDIVLIREKTERQRQTRMSTPPEYLSTAEVFAEGKSLQCATKEKHYMSKSMILFVAAVALALGGLAMVKTTATAAEEKGKERVFELRTYTAAEGKLDALNARFRDHTNKLFVKHGMELVGYWTPTDEAKGSKNTLIYVLAHASKEAADKSWKAFRDDPEWKAALKESEKD